MTSWVHDARGLLRCGSSALIACLGAAGTEAVAQEIFTDIASSAGIVWRHFNGQSEERLLVETTCGGVGFLDFDNDGYLDVFFVNGGETPKGRSESPIRHGLYRNLGGIRFEDVTEQAGIADFDQFGMGVAVADYDNDGFSDLFITGHPRCVLLKNDGNGRFMDVTDVAGVGNLGEWSASAAWFDYNRDGFLDLFVTNYATLSTHDPPRCEYAGETVYCSQTAYEGRPPSLYRGNGDGTFADVTERAGLRPLKGRALGVVTVDIDNDGWCDLFVSRDASPNLLLMNQGNETFQDRALEAEVAYSPDGIARAGMGVDAGDLNGDGAPDFVVTNFDTEFHALYYNSGSFPFEEMTRRSGLGLHSRPYVGWGTSFLDYDNDGDLDLITANGHLNHLIERTRHDVRFKQPLILLENNAKGAFRDRSDSAGIAIRTPALHRGLAVADIDNDGDPDVAVVRLNDQPVLLRNNAGQERPWLGLDLMGTSSNRDAIGAKVRLLGRDQQVAGVRWVKGGSSFLASSDNRVLFGLGYQDVSDALSIEIEWPGGVTQRVSGLAPNRYHDVEEPGMIE
jgi:hypothetical protein